MPIQITPQNARQVQETLKRKVRALSEYEKSLNTSVSKLSREELHRYAALTPHQDQTVSRGDLYSTTGLLYNALYNWNALVSLQASVDEICEAAFALRQEEGSGNEVPAS